MGCSKGVSGFEAGGQNGVALGTVPETGGEGGKMLILSGLLWLGDRDSNPDTVVQRGRKRRQ
jgi:hypothetical protein